MKLIHILALTMAIASVASGQSTGANNSQPAGKQAAAPPAKSPVVVAHPAPASKPTPVTRKTVSGKTSAAAKKTTTVKAKSVHPASRTAGKQAGSARPAAPAKKTGAVPGKPVVAVGSLPPKKKASTSGMKHVPAVQARSVRPAQKAKPAAKPKVAVVPAKKPEVKKTGAANKPAVKKAGGAGKPSRPSVARVEGAPKPEPKPRTPAKLLGAAGRRDPFVSPLRSANAIAPTSSCTSGKRCLSIPELVLQGTVRDISGKMMAVVSTSNRKTYTLRENDQVFNGSVEKITTDSIIFREYVRDPLGRESAREVVKKLGPTS
jgi:Tfp pilus assembly protein PilP